MRSRRATDPAATVDQAAVSAWFRRSARALPWRTGTPRSPYATLVSETMAQQTQIARVVDAFEAFMRRFPTLAALAEADQQDVLSSWRGLGYYRRALHLHAGAKAIVERFAGDVPSDPADLRTLPGVGRYTAGAVASIAFGRHAAIVDGNVARVLLRVSGHRASASEPSAVRWLWQQAQRLVDGADDPASFNEGLMELGAVVCTPRIPRCAECPLAGACVARRSGTVGSIPRPKQATLRRTVHHHAVVVRRGRRLLVEQRPATGLWARMWQVPTVEDDMVLEPAALLLRLEVPVTGLEPRGSFVHATTHRDVRVHVFAATSRVRAGRWVDDREMDALPMSAAARKVVALG